jgi:hypothetical protein
MTAYADQNFWDCPSIDTDEHIANSLGQPVKLPESIDTGAWLSDVEDDLLAFFKEETGQDYVQQARDNTYNSEQDLSSQFVFSIFTPEDCADWCWSDNVFVSVETHLGGDVRGNYSDFKIYRVDNIAETGFLDWVCGWHASSLRDLAGDAGELDEVNDELSVGYCARPTSRLGELLSPNTEPAWSDKHKAFVCRLADYAFPVLVEPVAPYYGS